MRLVFDTEGDGFLEQTTRLWCVVAKDIDTNEVYQYGPDEIPSALRLLSKASVLICHNLIGHDLPVLQKLYQWEPERSTRLIDTLVVSRAIWPDRKAHPLYKGSKPHSVEAYGAKFGRPKPEHEDWTQYSEEMLHRCTEDVHIQHEIYNYLLWEQDKYSFPDFSWKLETEVAKLIQEQEQTGFPFDLEKAKGYIDELRKTQDELFRRIKPHLGYALDRNSSEKAIEARRIARPFTKGGGLSKKLLSLCGDSPFDVEEIGGPFTYIELRLSSRDTIINLLYNLGWEPQEDEWNVKKENGKPVKGRDGKYIKTSPKLTVGGEPVESLERIGSDIGKDLGRWYILGHRRSQIQGWINRTREDGRLPAGANPCGANTSRMQHRVVVNVPQAQEKDGELIWDVERQEKVFGTQMRSLFYASDPWVLVGHDAVALEARVLAHYLNDPKLTKEILYGDFHTLIWSTIDDFVFSRSGAKNIEYAFIYGAGDSKLGNMADDRGSLSTVRCGAEIRKRINNGIPAIGDLTKRVEREANKGYVTAVDGRKLWVRSTHSALNTLFQGAGAIIMKTSLLFLTKWARREGIEYQKVLDMHDEAQNLVVPNQAELFGELAVKSVRQAGKFFNTRCPMDAEYKIGHNWAETH